ncbi:MAG: hypothetical protein GX834_06740 [Clostridiaceae bacterium]|nr:hypothetical protein [Clostridiaceae bacterium]
MMVKNVTAVRKVTILHLDMLTQITSKIAGQKRRMKITLLQAETLQPTNHLQIIPKVKLKKIKRITDIPAANLSFIGTIRREGSAKHANCQV